MTDATNNSANYSYLANSPLVSQIVFKQSSTAPMTTTKSYDYLNRLTQISSAPSGTGVPPVSFNYNYNPANQRTHNTLADGSYWVYGYDSPGHPCNPGDQPGWPAARLEAEPHQAQAGAAGNNQPSMKRYEMS